MLDFDPYYIAAGLFFGLLGMILFKMAKQKSDAMLTLISLVLMVYPYFITDPLMCWGAGFGLCALVYFTWT